MERLLRQMFVLGVVGVRRDPVDIAVTRTIMRALEVPGSVTAPVYLTIWVVWAAGLALAAWQLY